MSPHVYSSFFVMVTKSLPKNTPATPSTANSLRARGDFMPSRALGNS